MRRLLKIFTGLVEDFIYLIYPNICQSCEKQLVQGERVICLFCQFRLPQTDYHLDPENPVARKFWGRLPIEKATAFYFFTKGGKVQKLIYRLKYEGRKEIGIRLGQIFAGTMKDTAYFEGIDCIVPVPLHLRKKRKRGFNQCDLIAEGMANVLKIPWSAQVLLRRIDNVSQTGKGRFGRWENVEDIFTIQNGNWLQHKHVLLIDDVITTGSTLEACAQALLRVDGVRVSIATIACAQ